MNRILSVLMCIACFFPVFAEESDEETQNIVRQPLRISSGIEQGMIISGWDETYNKDYAKNQWISRLSVWLNQEVIIKERLTLRMGVGGMFWNPFPGLDGAPHTLVTKFGPGVAQATGICKIGNITNPPFELQFGYFPFKYNQQARNLGEYLLRSGAYPGYLIGGGWSIVGDALYRIMGIRFSNYLLDKSIKNHLIISMERDFSPMHDFALTYIGDATIGNVFDIGAGISFSHLIPIRQDKTTPEKLGNRYVDDKALGPNDGIILVLDTITNELVEKDTTSNVKHFTHKGVKIMAKACFDPKGFFENTPFGEEDFKLFGEIAILGVKDYPFYYDDITKRMPIMFGINIPPPLSVIFDNLFDVRLLDVFSVQLEWYGSEFANSLENVYEEQLPLWKIHGNDPVFHDDTTLYYDPVAHKNGDKKLGYQETYREFFQKDNWKWSLNMRKKFNKNFTLYLQMANDHYRAKLYTARPQYISQTNGDPKPFQFFGRDWYFVLRLNFGV